MIDPTDYRVKHCLESLILGVFQQKCHCPNMSIVCPRCYKLAECSEVLPIAYFKAEQWYKRIEDSRGLQP